ncbi:MAG: ATP-binding protein, partial [Phycisphaerae bacterium]
SALPAAPRQNPTRCVRPLLTFGRAQLRDYLQSLGQSWREDSTNQSPNYLRNRMRHELLPQLATYQPAIREVLNRVATQAREADETWEQMASELLQKARKTGWIKRRRRRIAVSRRFWSFPSRMAHRPIQGRLLQEWIAELGCGVDRIDATQLQTALDALAPWRTGLHLEFACGVNLDLKRDELIISQSTRRKVARPRSSGRKPGARRFKRGEKK